MDINTAKFVEEESISDGGDEPIVQNGLMFNRDKNFVYAMTPTKVRIVTSQNYDTYCRI